MGNAYIEGITDMLAGPSTPEYDERRRPRWDAPAAIWVQFLWAEYLKNHTEQDLKRGGRATASAGTHYEKNLL